jgi:hypothetical protein
MEAEYAARQREFGETYENYEATDEVCRLIVRGGDRLAALCLDDQAVEKAMVCLHQSLGLPDFPADFSGNRTWQALWGETPLIALLDLPLAQRLTSLNAYAYFGLSPTDDGEPCTLNDIKSLIEAVSAVVNLENTDRSLTGDVEKTLLAARARFALDEGNGVSPEQLAALVRLELKSMRNAIAPSSGSGLELKDGVVTADSAQKWLNARGDFKTSIWRDVLTGSSAVKPATTIKGEILWVPFASDNTEFDPVKCLRNGKYTVGPKGSEKSFTEYRQALDYLARMRPAAHWRRPNTVGNWGSVTAIGFRPRTTGELGLVPDHGDEQ